MGTKKALPEGRASVVLLELYCWLILAYISICLNRLCNSLILSIKASKGKEPP